MAEVMPVGEPAEVRERVEREEYERLRTPNGGAAASPHTGVRP